MNTHYAISLFSGAGGLDLGVEAAGFVTRLCTDIDDFSCKTLNLNKAKNHGGFLQEAAIVQKNIKEYTTEEILSDARLTHDQVDLVYGGPPCQAFSVFGKRQGINDPRGTLLWDYIRVIREIQPRAFIFENVAGLLTVDDGAVFEMLKEALETNESGDKSYTLSYALFNTAAFGVPQYRQRVIIYGIRDHDPIPLPKETHYTQPDSPIQGLRPPVTVGTALDGLPDAPSDTIPNHVGRVHGQAVIERYSKMAYGERDSKTRINRLDPNKPSYTIVVGSDTEEKTVRILKRLKEYGVLKAVKANDVQKDLSDLLDEDIEIADVEVGENEYLYVFTFVGVITIEGRVLKCYPKYIMDTDPSLEELKQVLKVLEKYNSKEQIIRMYNETSDSSAFNMLAVMLFLLQDYYEYGPYTNTQDIIEPNGAGSILWEKTINETFTLISNNRPYYPELLTMRRVNDDFDFFKRLHECILSRCTKELKEADLLDLFGIMEVNVSDEQLEDFGDKEYILDRLTKELNIQFNTRKQLLLKTLYAYIANSNALDDLDCFSMYGTNSFNLVWERVCAEVMDNQLQKLLGGLPITLAETYRHLRGKKLIDLIDKPHWVGTTSDGSPFTHEAADTLIPDLISIVKVDGEYQFNAQNQDEFSVQYNRLVERYETAKARAVELQGQRSARQSKADEIGAFMFTLYEMETIAQQFDPKLWMTTVSQATVHSDGRITFHFISGMAFDA